MRFVSEASEAGEQYVTVESTRGFVSAKPPRCRPLVLQKISVPFGAVKVRTSSAGTNFASSSSDTRPVPIGAHGWMPAWRPFGWLPGTYSNGPVPASTSVR